MVIQCLIQNGNTRPDTKFWYLQRPAEIYWYVIARGNPGGHPRNFQKLNTIWCILVMPVIYSILFEKDFSQVIHLEYYYFLLLIYMLQEVF